MTLCGSEDDLPTRRVLGKRGVQARGARGADRHGGSSPLLLLSDPTSCPCKKATSGQTSRQTVRAKVRVRVGVRVISCGTKGDVPKGLRYAFTDTTVVAPAGACGPKPPVAKATYCQSYLWPSPPVATSQKD